MCQKKECLCNPIGCINHNHLELGTFYSNISHNQPAPVTGKEKIDTLFKAALN